MRDPYAVLGVKRDADAGEIKSAWRSIAKKIHPDQNRSDPNAAKRFAEAGEAYEVLKDPKKRSRYDMLSQAGAQGATIQQQREAAREAAIRRKAAEENARKVMEELERAAAEREKSARKAEPSPSPSQKAQQGQAQSSAARPEADAPRGEAAGSESAEDVINRIFGAQPQFDAGSAASGHAQGGQYGQGSGPQGAASQTQTAQGQTAQGQTVQGQAGSSGPDLPSAEEKAAGKPLPLAAVEVFTSFIRRFTGGTAVQEKAPDQFADARVTIEELLKEAWITVPLPEGRDLKFRLEPGATDGDVIRMKGQGFRVPGMMRGDAVVTLRVLPTQMFRVDGHDIVTPLPVSLENAVLGCAAMAQSPTGMVEVQIPAWSGSDQAIRMPGLGLSDGKGGRGDLVVEIRLMLWEKPDAKVTDLMRSMREGLFL